MKRSAENMHKTAEIPDTPAQPPGLLMSGHFHDYLPYRVLRRQGTRDWVLFFTHEGAGRFIQEGVYFETRPGGLVLIEPDAYHDYGCVKDLVWDFSWAHFIARPHWLALMKWPLVGKGLRALDIQDSTVRERMRGAFERCLGDSRNPQSGLNDELAQNAIEEVLMLAAREQRFSEGQRPLSAGVRRAMEHLTAHLSEPQDVPNLARLAGLSPSRFAHRFKEETGDSAIAYLMKLRLREAARLLEFSGRSVKEVASDVGFESPFYFSRQFRRQFGLSPRAYLRKMAR